MSALLRPSVFAALSLLGGCSISFDRYLNTPPGDGGATIDRGAPTDTVVPPTDTGVMPSDTVVPPTDTVVPPTDTGVMPTECRPPYLLALAEHLDSNASRVLRWSYRDNQRCGDLTLSIDHPRALGVAFDNIAELTGPQLIVVNERAVHAVNLDNGATIRDIAADGIPRSVFDIVANGQGTFAVAYTFAGGSTPGSVGAVRVFTHRGNMLRQEQLWQRNMQFGLSVLWMTAYPGNQGQYTQIGTPQGGSGYAAFAAFPGSTGLHSVTTPGFITDRQNVVAATFYRRADRGGRYALATSATGRTPMVYVANSPVSSATQQNVFLTTRSCPGSCPAITRAVASPENDGEAAAICQLSGTEYTVERFGGPNSNCQMLDTASLGGRWRINDLAVVPR